MADSKISALPASTTPLAGTEVLPIVQSSTTKQVSVANLTAGRAISATELTLTTGNLIVASGKGVDFSATSSGSGTMTSELLADYEEGTWTPVYTPASGAFGTIGAANTGLYRRVGSTVFLWVDIRTTGTPDLGTASGQLYITGLPFTPSALGGYGQVSIMQSWNLGTALTSIGVVVDVSNARLYFTKNSSNSSISYVQATELSTAPDNFGNLMGFFAMYTV